MTPSKDAKISFSSYFFMVVCLLFAGSFSKESPSNHHGASHVPPTSSSHKSDPGTTKQSPKKVISSKTQSASRPAAKKGAKKTPKAAQKVIKKQFAYKMFYGKGEVGRYDREELHEGEAVTVKSISDFTLKFFFFKVRIQSRSTVKHLKGKMISFDLTIEYRSKKSHIWGKQDESGVTLFVSKNGGKPTKKFFKASSYDATGVDLLYPTKITDGKVTRRLLSLQDQKIQKEPYSVDKTTFTVAGKTWSALVINTKSKRGPVKLHVSQKGMLLESNMKVRGGNLIIRLHSMK